MNKNQGIHGNTQPQMGTHQGNNVNLPFVSSDVEVGGQMNPQSVYHSGYIGPQAGMKTGYQTGFQTQISTGQQAARFGANELMMVHDILTDTINSINQFELYRQFIRDQQLMHILDNQINFMFNEYNQLVNYLHNQGAGSIVPYRTARSAGVKYGLRQPAAVQPNANINEMDDSDVASGMLGCHKAAAGLRLRGALDCADLTMRNIISNLTMSSVNMAYEIFIFMNQKGMYQLPTLAQQTTQTMLGVYQNMNQPSFS
ncbi:spore coat protein [Phosphitispora sp. TUW77]|uniref:spore coat protein n=1 Tax=Phosphitispora sp. TUW77 TaxID=3152361 RepID=UPI003AB778C1